MTTIRFPILHTDVPFAVSPRQVVFNRFLLLGMAAVIRVVQGKLLQRRKMALNAIEPRGIGRRPVKLDLVGRRIRQHLRLAMKRRIVQSYMQGFLSRISLPHPFQKCQESRPVLLRRKGPDQCIPFQVIRPEHVPHAAMTIIGCPQSVDMAGLGIMPAVPRQQIQRAKLIDADPAAALGTVGIQPFNSPVFSPKLRIGGILPGLGMPPFDLPATQDLTQVFQRNRGDNLLGDQVFPQLGQRPDRHPNQLFGRGEGNFTDLFGDLRCKLCRSGRSAKAGRPVNPVDPAVIEAVNDLPHPGGRTVALLGNPAVRVAAAGQQNHPGMTAIDSVGQLVFHTVEFSAFIRPKRPCFDKVHVWFSTFFRLPHAACGEPIYTRIGEGASLLLKKRYEFFKNAKRHYWKRHYYYESIDKAESCYCLSFS